MTEATAAVFLKAAELSFSPDDPLIDFTVPDWVPPSLFIPHDQETREETLARQTEEADYRATASPTEWYRYLQLGRYTLTGPDFDTALKEYDSDPVKVHCIIWYHYTYHVERMMECSPQLEAWATRFSQPFLNLHRGSALLVDTVRTKWATFSKQQSLSANWSPVVSKPPKSPKKNSTMAASVGTKTFGSTSINEITTILEETSTEHSSAVSPGRTRPPRDDARSETSEEKMSVLIPNLNVPVCDGTYRITIRWKLPMEVNRISRQTTEMKEAIYKLLKDLFRDDDGYLYKWNDSGKERYNVVSKMSSTEVRQFICPSVTLIPSQSMAVIPLRFGFSTMTPTAWRNSVTTKKILEQNNATVSISNSTSTSGDLVISGYILLKAPNTTHRLRYLQSLRKKLPDTTPPFDILLHQRSPTDQLVPHLVVQCGERHAHALSEALMTILTGTKSAVFIPRSAFEQMSSEEAVDLFVTHDKYVQTLQWLPLSPMLTNLDRLRTEHYPDGSIIERTTREWARHIMLSDGITPANCDVVNGGTDQLAYLLFPPDSGAAAYDALEQYRTLIRPFKQREERYRGKVGPITEVHFNKKVIANLDFMRQLSSDMSTTRTKTTMASPQDTPAQCSTSSKSSTSSVSDISHASRPMTPAESLRQQWSDRDKLRDQMASEAIMDHTGNSASAANTDLSENSVSSRSSSTSKLSSSRMSTSSAKLREIEVAFQRQKTATAKTDQQSMERFVQMERQLHRINDVETKLDTVDQKMSTRFTDFEGRLLQSMKQQVDSSGEAMVHLNTKLEKLMSVMEQVLIKESQQSANNLLSASNTTSDITAHSGRSKTRSPDTAATKQRTKATVPPVSMPRVLDKSPKAASPEKKRLRSTVGKRRHKEAISMELDSHRSQEQDYSTSILLLSDKLDEFQPYQSPTNSLNDITTDLERRYTAQDAPTTSPARGSPS